jgi:hypothetical protein
MTDNLKKIPSIIWLLPLHRSTFATPDFDVVLQWQERPQFIKSMYPA